MTISSYKSTSKSSQDAVDVAKFKMIEIKKPSSTFSKSPSVVHEVKAKNCMCPRKCCPKNSCKCVQIHQHVSDTDEDFLSAKCNCPSETLRVEKKSKIPVKQFDLSLLAPPPPFYGIDMNTINIKIEKRGPMKAITKYRTTTTYT